LAEAVVPTVAIVTGILGVLRIFLIIIGALVQKRKASAPASEWRPGKIAVLVPAYNEEEVICRRFRHCCPQLPQRARNHRDR